MEKYDRPISDEYSGDVKATLSRFNMCSVEVMGITYRETLSRSDREKE